MTSAPSAPRALARRRLIHIAGAVPFWAVVASVFLFPYFEIPSETGYPHKLWAFPAASVTLVALLRLRGFTSADLGLPRTRRHWFGTLGAVALFLPLFWWWFAVAAERNGLELVEDPWQNWVFFVFQAFSEELLLGYLPLIALSRRFGPRLAGLGLAAVFAALHVALYGFGALQTWLTWLPIVTLFVVGALRNGMLLTAGHLGLAWALHACWNVFMLRNWARGPFIDWGVVFLPLSEPERFEVFLGDPVLLLPLIAWTVATWWRLPQSPSRYSQCAGPSPR